MRVTKYTRHNFVFVVLSYCVTVKYTNRYSCLFECVPCEEQKSSYKVYRWYDLRFEAVSFSMTCDELFCNQDHALGSGTRYEYAPSHFSPLDSKRAQRDRHPPNAGRAAVNLTLVQRQTRKICDVEIVLEDLLDLGACLESSGSIAWTTQSIHSAFTNLSQRQTMDRLTYTKVKGSSIMQHELNRRTRAKMALQKMRSNARWHHSQLEVKASTSWLEWFESQGALFHRCPNLSLKPMLESIREEEEHWRAQLRSSALLLMSDTSKPIRLNALKKTVNTLPPLLSSKQDVHVSDTVEELTSHFQDVLARTSINDPVDTCREYALSILICLVDYRGQRSQKNNQRTTFLVSSILPLIASKIVNNRFEEREEVKLFIVQLLHKSIPQTHEDIIKTNITQLLSIVRAGAIDSFDDIKKETCTLSISIMRSLNPGNTFDSPSSIQQISHESRAVAVSLCRCLGSNLTNKKTAVRQTTLECFRTLISCAGSRSLVQDGARAEDSWNFLPALEAMGQDGVVKNREVLVHVLTQWMTWSPVEIFDRRDFREKVFYILLMLCHDALPSVREISRKSLQKMGDLFLAEEHSTLPEISQKSPDSAIRELLGDRVDVLTELNSGVSALIDSHVTHLLARCMDEAQDWTQEKRWRGIAVLSSCVFYAHPNFVGLLDERFLLQLSIARETTEEPSKKMIDAACAYIGCVVDGSNYVPLLLAMIEGRRQSQMRDHLMSTGDVSRLVRLLHHLLIGFNQMKLKQHARTIMKVLESSLDTVAYLSSRSGEFGENSSLIMNLLLSTISACKNNKMSGKNVGELERSLKELSLTEEGKKDMTNLLKDLTSDKIFEKLDLSPLDARHTSYVLESIHSVLTYTEDSDVITSQEVQLIGPLKKVTDKKSEHVHRKGGLLIVGRIVDISSRNFEENSSKLCVTLLQEVLRPILIWSGGRNAAELRREGVDVMVKIFLAAEKSEKFQMILRECLVVDGTIDGTFVRLLESLMDDDDPQVRLRAISSLSSLFSLTHNIPLSTDTRHHLTQSLSKRFNDQDETVRISAVHLLAPLDTHSPHDDNLQLCRSLVLHLDDTRDGVQKAVYHVLSEMMAEGRVREAVRSDLEDAMKSHRNPGRYVEPLLKKTQEK
ncbi:hypothetical protein PROFUN_04382 [Planoprotostelium fungivorum]|uniref:Uncharacterized protein n=1 Tax=Planoprotostelium fungivorum TaxID=1890364 RepID=A0A2P6NHS7_9EUKA|nr:hypothetical protein PROFUN_04382 [Planoprotostelium fungivorum]